MKKNQDKSFVLSAYLQAKNIFLSTFYICIYSNKHEMYLCTILDLSSHNIDFMHVSIWWIMNTYLGKKNSVHISSFPQASHSWISSKIPERVLTFSPWYSNSFFYQEWIRKSQRAQLFISWKADLCQNDTNEDFTYILQVPKLEHYIICYSFKLTEHFL